MAIAITSLCTLITASMMIPSVGSAQQPTDCDYWGETATLVATNYDTAKRMGVSAKEAMAETKHLFDYDNHIKNGGMGAAYYGAVFEAIERGVRGNALYKVGARACRSFPAGTFDPDRFGKYD